MCSRDGVVYGVGLSRIYLPWGRWEAGKMPGSDSGSGFDGRWTVTDCLRHPRACAELVSPAGIGFGEPTESPGALHGAEQHANTRTNKTRSKS